MKIIKLTEEQIKFLEGSIATRENAHVAFKAAARFLKTSNEALWARIKELFPNDIKKARDINWKTKEIIFGEKEYE